MIILRDKKRGDKHKIGPCGRPKLQITTCNILYRFCSWPKSLVVVKIKIKTKKQKLIGP
jgi:hypothetical protein